MKKMAIFPIQAYISLLRCTEIAFFCLFVLQIEVLWPILGCARIAVLFFQTAFAQFLPLSHLGGSFNISNILLLLLLLLCVW